MVMPVVTAGRAAAERLMTDTVAIRRPGGEPDPLTGVAPGVLVYEGRAKLQTFEPHEQDRVAGGAHLTIQRSRIDLPVGDYRSQQGDVAEFTASTDPNVTGRRFRIVQEWPAKTHATAYRIAVDEVTT